jgi:predicted permease
MSTATMAKAPGLARRLLHVILGSANADQIMPGLAELFQLRAQRDGAFAARLWYWRQVLGFGARRRALAAARNEEVAAGLHGSNDRGPRRRFSLESWIRDTRLAVRALRRQPGFALLAITTLALGIGANTAIFSVLHGSLLRPLPYPEPDRLVWISDSHPSFDGAGANQSLPNLIDLQAGTQLLESVVLYKMRSANLATAGEPERVSIMYASSELFTTLRLPPQLGRDLTGDDDSIGSEPVAILTDTIWRTRFGADPSIVGQTTELDARPVLIAGVASPDFQFRGNPQIVMALQHLGSDEGRGNRGHYSLGRLAVGADLDAANAELQGIYAGLAEEFPEANEGWSAVAEPLADYLVGRNRDSLLLMSGAVALVLLIACVNVANLMLVRAESRHREFAVRYSLGATRAGLLSLFVSEGLVLAIGGGVLGVAAAYWGVDLLVALYGDSLARAEDVAVNGVSLAFGVAISVAVGVLVGLVPLLRTRPDAVHETLKEGARGSSATGSRLGRALVVVEVSLAMLIVAGAGLLINSVWRLQAVDLGLEKEEQVLTFRVSLPNTIYNRVAPVREFHDRMLDDLARVPGVEAVGMVNRLPLLGGDNMSVKAYDNPEVKANFVSYRMVTEGYFEAAGMRLLDGRLLDADDFDSATASVVINDNLARKLFPDVRAVGQRIVDPMLRPGVEGQFAEGLEVVGVIASVVSRRADDPAPAAYFFSFARSLDLLERYPETLGTESMGMSALVRASGDPKALTPDIRLAVSRIDPEVPIFEVRTLEEMALDRLGTRGFAMSLFGVFAGLALLLGAIGIYGVMSYGVAQRSRELGVRMALGANRGSVLRLVLGEGIRLTLPGLALGLIAALAASRLLGNLLFEVSAVDPLTFVAVALVLGAVCLAAAYLPALRATRVDPLTSIRAE